MTSDTSSCQDPPGAILAVHLNGCIARAYGGLVPMDDVVVALTSLTMEYLGRVDQRSADAYRAFIVENIMKGAVRQ